MRKAYAPIKIILFSSFVAFLITSCAIKDSEFLRKLTAPKPLKLKGDAADVLPYFYGNYIVKDSRVNIPGVDSVQISLKNDQVILTLYRKNKQKIFEERAMNDCTGFGAHKDGYKALICQNRLIGSRKPARFRIAFAATFPITIKSGTMLKSFDPMEIPPKGFHLEYNSGDSRIDSQFYLIKEEH